MKTLLFCSAALLLGCGASSHVHSDAALRRVVVYRNGIAYFERYAEIDDDSLELRVPPDKVDDLLKSLTVSDAATGAPAPVAYPTTERSEAGLVDMSIELRGPAPHRLKVSYVTEAPSWKPTYRVAVRPAGKVSLEALAVVDNVSGEDWMGIQLGVASSSALSFRYDLSSVRFVQRETLRDRDLFAIAPPQGGATYGGARDEAAKVLGEISDEALDVAAPNLPPAVRLSRTDAWIARMDSGQQGIARQLEAARAQRDVIKVACLNDKLSLMRVSLQSARDRRKALGEAIGQGDHAGVEQEISALSILRRRADQLAAEANQCIGAEAAFAGGTAVTVQVDPGIPDPLAEGVPGKAAPTPEAPPQQPTQAAPSSAQSAPAPVAANLDALVEQLRSSRRRVVVEGYAEGAAPDGRAASLARAGAVRDELIRRGIDAARVQIDGKGHVPGRPPGVRVVELPASLSDLAEAALGGVPPEQAAPIGAAHFESDTPMTVRHGSSAMVSILKAETAGEVVYLHDPEGAHGDESFPFRALRLRNPTDSMLDSGPVTVFGDGRFIGEGLCEPIPARGVAFIPFAMDRQIVVERRSAERDEIASVLGVTRGVFSAEVDHATTTTFTLTSRLSGPATVYLRHTVPAGHRLGQAPKEQERVLGAHLFRVELPPGGKVDVAIEDVASIQKTMDIRSPEGIAALKAYASGASGKGALQGGIAGVIAITQEIEQIEQRIATTREQIREYRARMDEMHAQLVTLRAVKSAGSLVGHLDKKAREASDRLSQATADLVSLLEQLMIARVRREDRALELTLAKEPEGARLGQLGSLGQAR